MPISQSQGRGRLRQTQSTIVDYVLQAFLVLRGLAIVMTYVRSIIKKGHDTYSLSVMNKNLLVVSLSNVPILFCVHNLPHSLRFSAVFSLQGIRWKAQERLPSNFMAIQPIASTPKFWSLLSTGLIEPIGRLPDGIEYYFRPELSYCIGTISRLKLSYHVGIALRPPIKPYIFSSTQISTSAVWLAFQTAIVRFPLKAREESGWPRLNPRRAGRVPLNSLLLTFELCSMTLVSSFFDLLKLQPKVNNGARDRNLHIPPPATAFNLLRTRISLFRETRYVLAEYVKCGYNFDTIAAL
ncbi:uncharacterized protein BDR25DRAFT_351987 [Lindgomyces ingoldianus]|uniref:Uncharacterized protein n=1 Tax=Lindgomyces ingoldianus TaxID=673940 RepID=A0ACB6R5A1_9PLEO|nr:uncharacterized protein BDR25DRAFT_351987 [Lindgomyces ingoldianus]KAF2474434.1 hypothetical protein BDR25DRAFT_351987 [Lindgomyces ingoldianus]